jgi:hypothetical protein
MAVVGALFDFRFVTVGLDSFLGGRPHAYS